MIYLATKVAIFAGSDSDFTKMVFLNNKHMLLLVHVVVQFYPWFKFYIPLFQTPYHTLPYPKTKGNKI